MTARRLRDDRGSAAIELPLGFFLILLPIAVVVMVIPQWPERQTVATAAAKEAATLYATAGSADFEIIAPQLIRSEIEEGKWYNRADMHVAPDQIDRLRGNVEHATAVLRHLSLLARAMHNAGILYEAT